jgi:hypothetical protein
MDFLTQVTATVCSSNGALLSQWLNYIAETAIHTVAVASFIGLARKYLPEQAIPIIDRLALNTLAAAAKAAAVKQEPPPLAKP